MAPEDFAESRENVPSPYAVSVTELLPNLNTTGLPLDLEARALSEIKIRPLNSLVAQKSAFDEVAVRNLKAGEEQNWLSGVALEAPGGHAPEVIKLLKKFTVEQPEFLVEVKKFFKGKVIVDIGAGSYAENYNIARLLGAAGYVGIEPFFAGKLLHSLRYAERDELKELQIPLIKYAVVPEDAATFLKRIPDSSVCVTSTGTSGIFSRDLNYATNIVAEIKRVLSPQGASLFYYSYIGEELAEQPEMKEEKLTETGGKSLFGDVYLVKKS